MSRIPPTVLVLLLLAGCGAGDSAATEDAGAASDRAVVKWLAESAIRLETVEAGNGFDDLQGLREVIGDARVVMLGEPTHGNREVFQLKHRLLEFLVEEMDFTAFVLETPMAESFDVHEYVTTGVGTPERALAAAHVWPWDTEEVAALLAWMRAYNATPGKPRELSFYGFDMQSCERACRGTLDYLQRVDPEFAAEFRAAAGHLAVSFSDSDTSGYRPWVERDADAAVQQAVDAALGRIDAQREAWSAATGAADWEIARQHARLLHRYVEAGRDDGAEWNVVRDRTMAENLQWILAREGPKGKIVVWAHNSHVSNDAPMYHGQNVPFAGHYMRRALGDEVVIVGVLCRRGGLTAFEETVPSRGVMQFELGPTPEGSIEDLFAQAGLELAVADLRTLPDGVVAEWFAEERPTRSSGAGYDPADPDRYYWTYLLPEAFDVLAFVDRTTPTRMVDPSHYLSVPTVGAPTNLDFEGDVVDGVPDGWQVWTKLARYGFEIGASTDRPYAGDVAAFVRRDPAEAVGEASGNIAQFVDASPYRGQRVRLRAAARVEPADDGFGFLRLRVLGEPSDSAHDGPAKLFDSLDTCRVTSAEWQVYAIEADIPENAATLSFGLYLAGSGAACLDDVQLEILDR